jgi:hypothetical protein
MPDVFTSWMIIALVLLCFAQDLLLRSSVFILLFIVGAAVAVHQSNVIIAFSLLPALALCAFLGWRPTKPFLYGFFASGVGLTLGIIGLIGMNLTHGRVGLSSGGSVFLLARMLGDGTALRYLEQACPEQPLAVCRYLEQIKSYSLIVSPTSLSDYFLWGGL